MVKQIPKPIFFGYNTRRAYVQRTLLFPNFSYLRAEHLIGLVHLRFKDYWNTPRTATTRLSETLTIYNILVSLSITEFIILKSKRASICNISFE